MQNLLFDTHHTLWLFHLFVGNINSECLDFRRHEETRIDFDQSAKSANHKSGADQQDESQRYLEHDERASCPVSMAALAHGTSAFHEREPPSTPGTKRARRVPSSAGSRPAGQRRTYDSHFSRSDRSRSGFLHAFGNPDIPS